MKIDYPSFTVCSVVYENDLPNFPLHARSIAHFLSSLNIQEIFICLNTQHSSQLRAKLEDTIHEFGNLASKVRFLTGDDLFGKPFQSKNLEYNLKQFFARIVFPKIRKKTGWHGFDGWQIQQGFKLLSARESRSDYLLILDTKNIFVAPVSPNDFITEDNRARTQFSEEFFHKRWYRASEKTLHYSPHKPIRYISFTTPFCAQRAVILSLLNRLEECGSPLEWIFGRFRNRATEFMMINAWAEANGGAEKFFSNGILRSYTVFSGHDIELAQRILHEALELNGKCIGLHSKILASHVATLTPVLCSILIRHGLCISKNDAELEIARISG